MSLNLLPFLMESFSTKLDIRKHIDLLYEKDSLRFYSLAKENEFYNHPIITDGDIYKEVYGKRALGLILSGIDDEEMAEEIIKIVRAGWPHTYNYIVKHEVINIFDYAKAFLERHGMTDDVFNSELTILYWLGVMLQKQFDLENPDIKEFVKRIEDTYANRLRFYSKTFKGRFNYSTFDRDLVKNTTDFRKRIFD